MRRNKNNKTNDFYFFRYEDPEPTTYDFSSHDQHLKFGHTGFVNSVYSAVKQLFNLSMIKYPSITSSSITKWGIILFSKYRFCLGSCIGRNLPSASF